MRDPKTIEGIDQRLKDLARECSSTAPEQRRAEIENKISTLCLQLLRSGNDLK
jgi:hypothetical protein